MKKFSLVLGGLGVFGLGTYITTQVYKTSKELEKVRSIQKETGITHHHELSDDNCSCNYSVDKTRAIYNRISKNYDEKVDFDEWLIGVTGLRKKLMLHVGGNVLEVAAGSGRNLTEYEKRKDNIEHLTLTDYSGGMLKQAKEKLGKDFSKPEIVSLIPKVDAHSLPFKDNEFDCTIDTFGLCSFEDPVKVLKEMNRVTKPGGKILLLEHGKSNKYQWLTNYLDAWSIERAKKWGCWWNRDIEKIVKESGLNVVKKEVYQLGTCYYYIAQKRVGNNTPVSSSSTTSNT